jgi:hypothetical protein
MARLYFVSYVRIFSLQDVLSRISHDLMVMRQQFYCFFHDNVHNIKSKQIQAEIFNM